MDKHNKFRNELLEADGITPNQVSDSERATFERMLKQKYPSIGRWRIIMRSRTFRMAVAAVILLALGLTLYTLTGSVEITSRVYAVTDIPELFRTAHTIHLKALAYAPAVEPNEEPLAFESEIWFDLINERWRSITPMFSQEGGSVHTQTNEEICNGGDSLVHIKHNEQQAEIQLVTPLQRAIKLKQMNNMLLQMTLGREDSIDDYQLMGQEEYAGVHCDVWELLQENGWVQVKVQAWVNPDNGDFLRGIVWRRKGPGDDWSILGDVYLIERNVPLEDSLFDYEIPSDYEVTPIEETEPWQMYGDAMGANPEVELRIHHLFALEDGSLVTCWSSRLKGQDNNQASLLQGFLPGDDFPELPVVVHALKQEVRDGDCVIPGRYLTHTVKDGIAYVWGIYCATDRPKPNESTSFIIMHRRYGSDVPFNVGLVQFFNLKILDERDFQRIMLVAMAELSNNQQAPDLTYKTMMALTPSN